MYKYFLKNLLAILLTASTGPVLAHSFSLGLIIPLSGLQLESGQQTLDGFLLATTEEDSHPDETSDGHLGGLDSHVFKIDSEVESSLLLESLEALVQSREPIFVTGLLSTDTAKLVAGSLRQGSSVFFDPSESLLWKNAASRPNAVQTMNGSSFSAKFKDSYGYVPTPEVIRGYIAARLIAATVRSLSEDALKDPLALSAALTRMQGNLDN